MLIEEILGASLAGLADRVEQKLVFVVGGPRRPFDALADVLRAMVGDLYCAAVPTFQLDDREHLATLNGARLNISVEYGDGPLPSNLSALLTGAPRRVRTGKPTEWSKLDALHLVSTTALPKVVHAIPAVLARRVAIVDLRGGGLNEPAEEVAAKILAKEGGAILARAMQAASRLVAHGPRGAPDESAVAVDRWARGADVIALFLASSRRVRRDPSARVSSRELHAHYLEWARAADEPLLTLPALVRGLERAGAARRTSTGRRRLLAGLALD